MDDRDSFDQPPESRTLTDYDRKHMILYLRLIDADADGADRRETMQILYGLDTTWTNGLTTPSPTGENKYINSEIHKAAFALPEFFRKELYE